MGIGNSDCYFWNVYPMKMRVSPLFLIPQCSNSFKLDMKIWLRLELEKVKLNKYTGIYKKHICKVDSTKNGSFAFISKSYKKNSQIQYKKIRFRMKLRKINMNVKPVLPDDIFEMMTVLNWVLCFISPRYTLKYTELIWNWDNNENKIINLYMNISFSNWHIWSIDSTKLTFLTLFEFDTRILTSKHPKPIRT